MGGRGKADRQAPRFAHREDEGVVVGSQQSDEKEEGVKKAPCACRWELLSPLSTPRSCISYMTDSVFDRPKMGDYGSPQVMGASGEATAPKQR